MNGQISGIKGMVIPLPTPFLENGMVDEEILVELTEFYIKAGVNAVFVLGSFGQGPALAPEQRKRVAEVTLKQINRRVPTLIHVGAVDPYTCVELGLHAKEQGADAIAVVGPYYYSDRKDQEIAEHYKMIDQAVGLPILIYNNPEYQGYRITPSLMANLVEAAPRIFGSKLAKGSVSEARQYLRVLPKEFSVFAPAGNLFPGMLVGISGTISPPLSAYPELGVQMVKTIGVRDWVEATKLQLKIFDFLEVVSPPFARYGRIAQCEALRFRGFKIKRFPRWPTPALPDEVKKKLFAGLEKLEIPRGH
ncbi:MAG: dihydrodipicolinate synthase family protein [Candidatus Binatia bacterium]